MLSVLSEFHCMGLDVGFVLKGILLPMTDEEKQRNSAPEWPSRLDTGLLRLKACSIMA